MSELEQLAHDLAEAHSKRARMWFITYSGAYEHWLRVATLVLQREHEAELRGFEAATEWVALLKGWGPGLAQEMANELARRLAEPPEPAARPASAATT